MTRNAKDQQKHAEPKQLNSDKERVKDSSLPDLDLNLDDDEALLAALEDALQADVGQAASATSSTKDANAASKTESTEHAQSTPAAAQTAQRATALQAESSAAQAEVEKRLDEIRIEQKEAVIRICFTGDGFLYHMVRILTGTLVEVGLGLRSPEEMDLLLKSGSRADAGRLMPPEGLTLLSVEYS